MKKKTFIKEGAFQKVPNNKGTTIKGALNLNKEILDTLVDKDIIGTTDCCQYFPLIPTILESQSEDLVGSGAIPPNTIIMTVNGDGEFQNLLLVYLQNGEFTVTVIAS